MVLQKIPLLAIAVGAILTGGCVLSLYPDPNAVIQGSQAVEPRKIVEMALCGAPLGIGFVLSVIIALANP